MLGITEADILYMNLFQPGTLLSTGVACTFEIAAGASATRTPVELAQALMTLLASGGGTGQFTQTETAVGKSVTAAVEEYTSVASGSTTATVDENSLLISPSNLTSNLTECSYELQACRQSETSLTFVLTVVALIAVFLLVICVWRIIGLTSQVAALSQQPASQKYRRAHDQALADGSPQDAPAFQQPLPRGQRNTEEQQKTVIEHALEQVQHAKGLFLRYDTDRSGSIDGNELQQLLVDMGKTDVDPAILEQYD